MNQYFDAPRGVARLLRVKCKLCNAKVETWTTNNPQPILPNFEDRVCKECNSYVTATRFVLSRIYSQFDASIQSGLYEGLATMLQMSANLRSLDRMHLNRSEEE